MRSLVGEIMDGVTTKPGEAPVPYTARRSGLVTMLGGSSGMGDNREQQAAAYSSNGTLFAIVGGIAQDVAAVKWGLWKQTPSGKAEDRPPVTSHAALDVWEHPNPVLTKSSQSYVEVVQQHIDLTGEGWNLMSRHRLADWPIELWPIYPHRMEPVPSEKPGQVLAGYVYSSPDGEQVPLEVADVGLIRQPHPLDFLRGLGVVAAIATDLECAHESGQWNRNFFRNSAVPGGIIEFPTSLTDDEFDTFRARWREQHQGVSNAHRVAMIEMGAKWVDRAYSMRDMQFVELRGVSREAIREAYRYPTAMLGESKDVNRAVAEAHKSIYAEIILVPRLRRWKAWLNTEFLPAFGDTAKGLEFDFVSPVNGDADAVNAERESKATAAKMYIEMGWEPESVKAALDLPEALVWAGGPEPQPAAPAGQPALQVDSWRALTGAITGHAEPSPLAAAAEIPPGIAAVQADWQAALDQSAADWQQPIEEQQDSLAAQVGIVLAAGSLLGLVGLTVTTAGMASVLSAAMAALATTAAKRVVEEAAAQGVTVTPIVFGAETFQQAAEVTAALCGQRWAMSAAGEAHRLAGYGQTPDQVSEAVRTHLAGLSDAPVRDALGGALTRAQNVGRLETIRHAPAARWFAAETLDGNTCRYCKSIDGHEFATLERARYAYAGGGYILCDGRERCRGMVIPIWENDEGEQ
jgi:HK97 family phage portal protein